LEITKKGQTLLAKCKRHRDTVEAGLIAGMSDADEEAVRAWLVRVVKDSGELK
jgi:DNA-binding MarR family transcriptional regulator